MSTRRGVTPDSVVLHVSVNRERCQGHARCAALAPELFGLDENGEARVLGDGAVPAHLVSKAFLASANCPELALDVTDGECA